MRDEGRQRLGIRKRKKGKSIKKWKWMKKPAMKKHRLIIGYTIMREQ
jgi:hypothetical protein